MHGRAREWFDAGSFFTWRPVDAPPGEPARQVFHAEVGDPEAPLVLLVHGFPTSSVDWYDVAPLLAREHRVAFLDFPGFGFSAKPRGGPFTIARDSELLDHYLTEVLGVDRGVVVAHDRGSSVALELARRCQAGTSSFRLDHLVLSNANLLLPLSNLTEFQRLVLHAETAPAVLDVVTPELLAAGMGTTTFTPPRGPDDPAIEALAQTFAHDDGTAVVHDTIQYLFERAEREEEWLEGLHGSTVPTTVVWGLRDTVSPPRVATHIWVAYLSTKPGVNELWFLPKANHYLQHDDPEGFVEAVTRTISGTSPEAPGALGDAADAPLLVDRSRPELPPAHAVLAAP